MAMNFDDLSRALAAGMSRKQAVKVMGGALAGGVAAMMGLDRTLAAPNPCSVLCGKTGFTSGPAHASCLQACRQCNADVSRICTSPTGSVCCPEGQICFNGTCTTPLTCTSAGCDVSCVSTTGNFCGCVTTAESTTACVQTICTFTSCVSSADCPSGQVCFTEGCCGPGGFCIPLCA